MIQLTGSKLTGHTTTLTGSGDILVSSPTTATWTFPTYNVQAAEKEGMKRVVNIYVVDPDDAVPLGSSVLYQKEGLFTDKTDRELYFDIPIQNLLATHNTIRGTIDRKGCDTETNCKKLPEAKIRDLKMVVVEVAKF